MIVVSDTSPINYLLAIGHVEVLPRLFGTIIIPATVMAELEPEDAGKKRAEALLVPAGSWPST